MIKPLAPAPPETGLRSETAASPADQECPASTADRRAITCSRNREIHPAHRPAPYPPQESPQYLTAIHGLVHFVFAFKKDGGVRFRRPLLEKRGGDLDMVDQHLEPVLASGRVGVVADVQELVPARECGGQFPKRIALNIGQRNMEIDVFRLFQRCRHRNIPLTDDLLEVGVVAGVGAQQQAQAGVLVGVHRGAPCADADTHHPLVGKEPVQVQFQLVFTGQHQNHR